MLFDSASEEESEGKSVILKCKRDDLDEIGNEFFIITLVEGIYDNDHR